MKQLILVQPLFCLKQVLDTTKNVIPKNLSLERTRHDRDHETNFYNHTNSPYSIYKMEMATAIRANILDKH